MIRFDIRNIGNHGYQAEEAYKRLRNNLQLSGEEVQVIEITGCVPNAGKTEVSMNLAMSFAELGKRVLLIDADLRHSVMAKDFRIKGNSMGLSQYLSGIASLDDVVGETNIPNMDLILAGKVPPNPAELLGGKRFAQLIDIARANYDCVIIDTPPLANVVDAQIVATQVDGVALVIEVKSVSRNMVRRIIEDLQNTGTPFLGIVLNKVNFDDNGAYGKYYGAYYGKYYGSYYGNYYGDYYGNDEDEE